MKNRRQKGTGSLFLRADGYWLGQVNAGWGADGKRIRKTVSGRNRAAVQRRLNALVKQLDETGSLPAGALTVKAWAEYWLEKVAAPRVRPRTLVTYRGHVANYIVPAIGRVRLDRVGPQHLRQVKDYVLDKGLSSTTAQHAHVTLVKCLSDARREGAMTRDVKNLVDAPARAVSTRTALTADQAIQMLRVADGTPLFSRWAMALFTGQRQGECLGLEADRVYDDRLDISWQLQRLPFEHGCGGTCGHRRGGNCPDRRHRFNPDFEYRGLEPGLFLTRPKSKAGWRIIPLVEPLRSILGRHLDGRTEGLVWTRGTDDPRPIDPGPDNRAWHAALKAAGIPPVPLHAARHTTATLLLEAGVDAHVVAQILGQSSIITSRGYQHVSLALATDALTAMGRALTAE